MQQEDLNHYEIVSALVDDQLTDENPDAVIEWVGAAHDARQRWHAYHLVGDVMRSGAAMAGMDDRDFVRRFKLRLEREPALAPAPAVRTPDVADQRSSVVGDLDRSKDRAANEQWFRLKLVAAVVSLAAVMVIGWQTLNVTGTPPGVINLVRMPEQTSTHGFALETSPAGDTAGSQVMIRDVHLDTLLAAHGQFGGTSALQMPAGFLRNATFEGAAR